MVVAMAALVERLPVPCGERLTYGDLFKLCKVAAAGRRLRMVSSLSVATAAAPLKCGGRSLTTSASIAAAGSNGSLFPAQIWLRPVAGRRGILLSGRLA